MMEVMAEDLRSSCQVHAIRGGVLSDVSGTNSADSDTAAVKQAVQEKAGEGVGLVGDKATDVAGVAQERAGEVAGEASSQVRNVAGELRDQLQGQAETQTRRLAGSVRQFSDELGTMGESGEPSSPATRAVRQIAGRGQDMAARLEDRGPQGLISDLQDFARRRPGVFLAGAALAGFAAARLGKGVKSASNGADANQGGRSAGAAGDNDRSAAVADGYTSGAGTSADPFERAQPTPSYGGSISPPGPLPVTDPYPNPDPRQP
ncbi:hypothetical protein ACFWVP_05905 [Streptomyces sp. NPDC058637]|uniref:hypothetical protein n=1 Tax=Streptomyces sp. NPDC058637 TaxID=3346569 RepID=UPI003657C746